MVADGLANQVAWNQTHTVQPERDSFDAQIYGKLKMKKIEFKEIKLIKKAFPVIRLLSKVQI